MTAIRPLVCTLILFSIFIGLHNSHPAQAQIASALVRESESLPGNPPADLVSAINNSAVNHAGGYAFSVTTQSLSGTTTSHIWGSASGGAGSVIRSEGTFGSLTQTSFESFFGISNAGNAAYSASGTGGPVGTFDSVWLDDNPVAVEGDPHPTLTGQFWRFASRPGVTADGTPYFNGGITDTAGGSTQNRGLFFGADGGTVVLLGGQAVPGLPFVLSTANTVSFDYRFSALATNYLAEVQMDSGSSGDDVAMVLNGSGLLVDGTLVREGNPLPASIGGLPGENWDNFDFVGITEAGQWLLTGDSDAATSQDEFVIVNGQIVLREGDSLSGGEVLNGSIEGGYMNENGDWAVIWDADVGTVNLEALLLGNDLLLLEGDAVDWNGDGVIDGGDAGGVIDQFTGISALTVGDRDNNFADLYFTADVSFPTGAILEGGFRLTTVIPEPSLPILLAGAIAAAMLGRRRYA